LETLQDRLLERGKTSGRADDNMETIIKRFKTFEEESIPVINYYSGLRRCLKIVSTSTPDEVYSELTSKIQFI
jgi:adenylate kinase family enzyme